MSDQFNKCSKCNSKYVYPEQNKFASGCGDHEHFIKKNGKLFCVDCLISEGHVKCSRCHKLVTHRGKKDIPTRVVFLSEHEHCCDLDKYPSTFSYSCESCWSSGRSHFRNKCKISFCSQRSHYDCEDLCEQHSKPCQGIHHGKKCGFPIESNGGDLCKGCQSHTEEAEQYYEKFCQAMVKAQNYWDSLSSSERERECERLVENIKLGKYWGGKSWRGREDYEGYGSGWAHSWRYWGIKNGKFVSETPRLVPVELGEEFMEKECGNGLSKALRDYVVVEKDNNSNDKDNSPSPNPKIQAPQSITNSNEKSDNSANPGNSPRPNPEKDSLSEEKNNVKTIRFENKENNSQNNSVKSNDDDKVQIIDPRSIKQITLTADGNLVIEFNSEKLENGDSVSENQQVITSEQISNSQELQKIRNYCQRNNKSVLSQQELNSILAANSSTTESPKGGNNTLLIGGIICVVLIVGVVTGLLLKKRKVKRKLV